MVNPVKTLQAEEEAETTYDTGNPEQVNTQRKKAARTRADRLEFVRAAMQHQQGRSWFYDVLIRSHVLNRSFDPDPYIHAYKAGEVNIGMQILDDVQTAAPDKYLTMISENQK